MNSPFYRTPTFLFLLFASILSVWIGIYNRDYGSALFIHDGSDIYGDLINPIIDSCNNSAYSTLKTVYSPLLLWLLSKTVDCSLVISANAQLLKPELQHIAFGWVVILQSAIITLALVISHLFNASRYKQLLVLLVSATFPPVLFGLDRLNLIIVNLCLIICAFLLGNNADNAQEPFQKNLFSMAEHGIWLLQIVIKPYFIILYLVLLLIRVSLIKSRLYSSVVAFCVIMSLFMLLNLIPFSSGQYEGNIFVWIKNILSFSSIDVASPSHIWNMNYYSSSFSGHLQLYPQTNFNDFILTPSRFISLYGITGKILDLLLSLPIAFLGYKVLLLIPKVPAAYRSSLQYLVLIALVYVPLVATNPNWGYYSASLYLLPTVFAVSVSSVYCYPIVILLVLSVSLMGAYPWLWYSSLSGLFIFQGSVIYSYLAICKWARSISQG